MTEQNNTVNVLGRLTKFHGNGTTNLSSFIKSFEKRANLERWTEEDKCNLIRLLCADSAEVFLESLPNIDTLTYDQIKQSLKERYAPKITTAEAYSMLMAVRQKQEGHQKLRRRNRKESVGSGGKYTRLEQRQRPRRTSYLSFYERIGSHPEEIVNRTLVHQI